MSLWSYLKNIPKRMYNSVYESARNSPNVDKYETAAGTIGGGAGYGVAAATLGTASVLSGAAFTGAAVAGAYAGAKYAKPAARKMYNTAKNGTIYAAKGVGSLVQMYLDAKKEEKLQAQEGKEKAKEKKKLLKAIKKAHGQYLAQEKRLRLRSVRGMDIEDAHIDSCIAAYENWQDKLSKYEIESGEELNLPEDNFGDLETLLTTTGSSKKSKEKKEKAKEAKEAYIDYISAERAMNMRINAGERPTPEELNSLNDKYNAYLKKSMECEEDLSFGRNVHSSNLDEMLYRDREKREAREDLGKRQYEEGMKRGFVEAMTWLRQEFARQAAQRGQQPNWRYNPTG